MKSTKVDGIKISRLNELGMKDAGNPIAEYNKHFQREEMRTETMRAGAIQTKFLSDFNAEAKVQLEAIQDFSCNESLFNKIPAVHIPSKTP